MFATFFLSFFFLFQAPTVSPRAVETPKPVAAVDTLMNVPDSVTKQSVRIGGKQLNYTVTAGYMPIRNQQTLETEAKIFYMAYTLDNPPAKRPLMFSFNGGPGLGSGLVYFGGLGPERA